MRKKLMPLIFSAVLTTSYAQTFYVSPNGTGDCSQANPCDLATALQNASINGDNDVVYLKEGTYFINNATYAPTGNEWNLTLEGMQNVVIDGANGGRILYIDTTGTDNDDGRTITIKNIIFQKGLLEGNNEKGAGAYIKTRNANIKVENCKFKDNTVTQDADGGGLYIYTGTGSIEISKSYFEKNNSDDYSGGFDITSKEGRIIISHSIIKENSGGYGGGGSIETEIGRVDLINNIIFNNKSTALGNGRGGGVLINLVAGESFIINNTIADNKSSAYGGGIHIKAFSNTGKINIYNNIIYDNIADVNGDDVYIETENGGDKYTPYISIENNDFKYIYIENLAAIQDENKFKERYNLNEDPLFKDRLNGDYHLTKDSPVVDKGDASPILPIPETDIDGEQRIYGNGIDIGADEIITQAEENNSTIVNENSDGGGGGGCSLSIASSPINALLYLALPFVLLVRRFLRGLGD